MLLSTAAGHVGDCLNSDRAGFSGSSDYSGSQPTANAVTLLAIETSAADTGSWGIGTKAEGHHLLYGRAGDGVAELLLHTSQAGTVTGSVENGFWAAWWPAAEIGDDLSVEEDPVVGATLKLVDGRVIELDQEAWSALQQQ